MNGRNSNPFKVIKEAAVTWWDDWTNWVLIGFAWMVSWITIVLAPPATFGIYYVAEELIQGRSLGFRGMLEGGRRYFIKSWVWMLVNVVVVFLVVVNFQFYGGFEQDLAAILQGVVGLIGILWIAVQFYALPYFMLQETKSLRMAWKNAFLTILASPFFSLVIYIAIILILIPCFITIVPLMLGVQGLIAVIGCTAVNDRVTVFGIREREQESRDSN